MALTDALQYRLPLAGFVSILHRVSGVVLFLFLPFLIWLFDASVSSEVSYARFSALFALGAGGLPGGFYKAVVLLLIWAYLHHFIAGLRHLHMDVTNHVSKEFGRISAVVTLGLSLVLTLALALKLFFF